MCSVVEKIKRESLEEGIALGEERGTEKAKREIVQSLYKTQMPLEVIAQICDMPVSKVRQILAVN